MLAYGEVKPRLPAVSHRPSAVLTPGAVKQINPSGRRSTERVGRAFRRDRTWYFPESGRET